MCDYCGCRSDAAIASLGAQHEELLWLGEKARRAIVRGDDARARHHLQQLLGLLEAHTALEEAGIIAELVAGPEAGASTAAAGLLDDHRAAETLAARVEAATDGWQHDTLTLIADLETHIHTEEYDVFPAALVAIGSDGWARVDAVHAAAPGRAATR